MTGQEAKIRSFKAEWKDIEATYNLIITEDKLIYNRGLRYGGHIPMGAVGAAQIAYAKAKGRNLEGEEEVAIALSSISRAEIKSQPYYGYSSFRNVFTTFSGIFLAIIFSVFLMMAFPPVRSMMNLLWLLLNIPLLYFYGRLAGFLWARLFSRKHLLIYCREDNPAMKLDVNKLSKYDRRDLLGALKQFAGVSQES